MLRAGGRSAGTIGLRRAHMRMLQEWARPRGPWELTTEDLLEWTASKDWSSETRRSVRSSLRGFYTWGLTTRGSGRTTRRPTAGGEAAAADAATV